MPRRVIQLLLGLFLYGAGCALTVEAGLGVDPDHTFEVHDTLLRATGSHSLHLGATASVVQAHATASR